MNTSPQDSYSEELFAYPRPQLEREAWISLNGTWDFAFDPQAVWTEPEQVVWDRKIAVPFSPETPASGIGDTGFYRAVWYRRQFAAPALKSGEHLLLHFGAVDYAATVWLNGRHVFSHEGGYTPFHIDITSALNKTGPQEVIVRAEDDPADLAKPRGKQDWKLEPHSIWYPRTTGIWQTVWFEVVPATSIDFIHWNSNLERWEIGIEVYLTGNIDSDLILDVKLTAGGTVIVQDSYRVLSGEVHRQIALSDPGIDDSRNDLLWSPSSPTIIDAELELRDGSGRVVDRVKSYTALRSIAIQGDRFILNGRPLNLRLVLDQGYWPDSGLTAPSDTALLHDVLLAKKLGFNGVRKHQKIEAPRYFYWADHMGLLVWEEMPSAYRYTRKAVERLTREWVQVLKRDCSHPCIVTWVPFNESWGIPNLPESLPQRHYVQALYHLTKTFDTSRPVIGNDGWESVATDIIGIHDYDSIPERIAARYGLNEVEAHLFKRERPGGRMLLINGEAPNDRPIMITEFGGIALSWNHKETWGYSRSESSEQLLERYAALLEVIRSLPAIAGFCYTQFADTYQESNGLVFADRTPKAPIDDLAVATTGARPDRDERTEAAWREILMERQR